MAGVVSSGLMLSQIQGPPCIWGWLIFPIQHIVYLAVRCWFTHALPHPDTGYFLDSIVFCVYWPWSSAGLDWYDITAPFARIIAGVCRLVGLLCFVVRFFPPVFASTARYLILKYQRTWCGARIADRICWVEKKKHQERVHLYREHLRWQTSKVEKRTWNEILVAIMKVFWGIH